MATYLEFENDVRVLEEELQKLKEPFQQEGLSEVNTEKISKLQNEIDLKLQNIYSSLNPWQITQIARHENRPKSKFYIENLFTKFTNLAGDRQFAEDQSVLAGFALFEEQSVLVIGQEKGSDLESRIKRNFGMMRPEGYRKCVRLMNLADKFNIPIILFIDTPGAYPGIGAEQRGQAEAIARSIECSMSLKVPTISIIIGEGGSGGAIALASSNKVLMFENSIYSVISPEGCASILWKNPNKSVEAAEAMKISAENLFQQGIIDEIIKEPTGGAHRDKDQIIDTTRVAIRKNLDELKKLSRDEIFNQRKTKFLKIGRKEGFVYDTKESDKLSMKQNLINLLSQRYSKNKVVIIGIIFLVITSLIVIFN